MSSIYRALSGCIQPFLQKNHVSQTYINLHSGDQVRKIDLVTTLFALDQLGNHSLNTLLEQKVFEKAKHPYSSNDDSDLGFYIERLESIGLFDNNLMHQNIALIVRNCFMQGTVSVIRLNPLTGRVVEKDFMRCIWSETRDSRKITLHRGDQIFKIELMMTLLALSQLRHDAFYLNLITHAYAKAKDSSYWRCCQSSREKLLKKP